MTSDKLPLLTPYPRPNHVRRLRQERERRRGRIGIFASAAVGIVAIGGGTVAFATESPAQSEAAQTQLATAETAEKAQDVIDSANALLERADTDAVDASTLTGYVDYLEGYESMPDEVAVDAAEKTEAEVASVTDDMTAYEDEQAALEKEKAEQKAREKQQAEEAAAAEAEAAAAAEAQAAANTVEGAKASARDIMMSTYGWGDDQFACLDSLWTKESGWNYQASNPSSGAYGIPQSLPGSKMATVADDWETNATTQVTWGLDYISRAYGVPCSAWGHSQAVNWY
ncbi:MAG: phospholipase [Microbacterium gubbeenense]|uniref:aggregation-promoting factor C-terminal-like domain-containing protein n=1 Tax=Microbacterium gubbeenense TaxID=159896 RepID=UPI003F9CF47A